MTLSKVGVIKLDGSVCITDPCYDYRSGEYSVWDLPIISGEYNCCVETTDIYRFDDYIKAIYIFNINYHMPSNMDVLDWKKRAVDISVDSGQAGFFKSSIYQDDYYIESDQFYDETIRLTMTKEGYGLLEDKGFVASSGFGDGSYKLYYLEAHDAVYALKLVFIEESEIPNENNDWGEENTEDIVYFKDSVEDNFILDEKLDDFDSDNISDSNSYYIGYSEANV